MHKRLTGSLAALALGVVALTASSQVPSKPADSQDAIPRELVLALLNLGPGMAGAGVELRVGKPPDDIPVELLPPGMEILGSTTQFESSVIVLAAPQGPDSAISLYEAHLLAAGWTKPPTPRARPMRGFVSADVGQFGYQPTDIVCHGDTFVTYAGSYRRMGGSVLKVTFNRGNRYSMCKTREDATGYRSPYDEAPVPLLRAPFGAMSNEGNGMSSSGNNSFTLSTRLTTKLKPGELATHYDKQMREQGWTAVTDGSLSFLAAHTYRKNDDQGRQWTAMLFTIVLPDTTQQQAMLQLTRSQAPIAK